MGVRIIKPTTYTLYSLYLNDSENKTNEEDEDDDDEDGDKEGINLNFLDWVSLNMKKGLMWATKKKSNNFQYFFKQKYESQARFNLAQPISI